MQFQVIQLNEVDRNKRVVVGSDPGPFHVLGQWLLWQLTKVSNLSGIFSSQGREAQALCLLGPRALGITSHGVSIRQSGLLAAHLCNQPG